MQAEQQPQTCPDLPKWLWLYLPIAYYLFRYGSFYAGAYDLTPRIEKWMQQETGVIEILSIIFLLAACATTIALLIKQFQRLSLLLRILFVCYACGCFFIAGEEASWGQHFFGWATPESFNNVQNETNLHNSEVAMKWFNRLRLWIGHLMVVMGGVLPVVLLIRRTRINPEENRWWWLYPTYTCVPTALCILIASLPRYIVSVFGNIIPVTGGTGEFKESYIALFFLLYISSLYYRMKWMQEHERHWRS